MKNLRSKILLLTLPIFTGLAHANNAQQAIILYVQTDSSVPDPAHVRQNTCIQTDKFTPGGNSSNICADLHSGFTMMSYNDGPKSFKLHSTLINPGISQDCYDAFNVWSSTFNDNGFMVRIYVKASYQSSLDRILYSQCLAIPEFNPYGQ